MITADLVVIHLDGIPVRPATIAFDSVDGKAFRRADAERWFQVMPRPGFDLRPIAVCQCCGRPADLFGGKYQPRCERHLTRNPCAVEGCKRTTSADGELSSQRWLCGTHWRLACPPRSLRRRGYHAFFRKAKRYGWTDDLRRQYWRYWFRLVRIARRRAVEGHIDMAMLERLFGR